MAKAPLKGKEPAAKAAPKKAAEPGMPKTAKTAAKPVAPKKTAQPAAAKPTKSAKKTVKRGDRYSCEVCGLIVSVDEACGCVEACDIICCGAQMKAKK
jgi:hypothetical protein